MRHFESFLNTVISITGATNAVSLSTTPVIGSAELRTFFFGVASAISATCITWVIGKGDNVEK